MEEEGSVLEREDEFEDSEDEENGGIPDNVRAAEKADESGPTRPNVVQRNLRSGVEEDERPAEATSARENLRRVAGNLAGKPLGRRPAGGGAMQGKRRKTRAALSCGKSY